MQQAGWLRVSVALVAAYETILAVLLGGTVSLVRSWLELWRDLGERGGGNASEFVGLIEIKEPVTGVDDRTHEADGGLLIAADSGLKIPVRVMVGAGVVQQEVVSEGLRLVLGDAEFGKTLKQHLLDSVARVDGPGGDFGFGDVFFQQR